MYNNPLYIYIYSRRLYRLFPLYIGRILFCHSQRVTHDDDFKLNINKDLKDDKYY